MENHADQLSVLYQARLERGTSVTYPIEHRQIMGKYTDLFRQVKSALPEDKKHLMSELGITNAALVSIHEETGYRLGFGDAFKLSATVFVGGGE